MIIFVGEAGSKMNLKREDVLELVKLSLWEQGCAWADREIFEEFKVHALLALPGYVLPTLSLPPELLKEWKTAVYKQITTYDAYILAQSRLPISVPYVILKGSNAAKYYPHPELRYMGDIDIMTRREDYETACKMLLENGYEEVTGADDWERARHRAFERYGVEVEVHILFASLNDPEKAWLLDEMIIDNIDETHNLPDLVNGLVLIEHISQHMEDGLGLRQIIDFMMFADRCLTDETWPDFLKLVRQTGLESLTLTVTRMCEMYLGLKEHTWCRRVNSKLCKELLDYVMASGNFGGKREKRHALAVWRGDKLRHPIAMLKELQRHGAQNWPRAKNPLLRPFAWFWQGIQFSMNPDQLAAGYMEAQQRSRMFDALGVRRTERGRVYYENGRYITK